MTPENISKKIKNYRYTKRALYSGSIFKNGASNGIELEKLYVNFAQLTLHEAELVHQLERQLR